MPLLLAESQLAARRDVAASDLAPLVKSLERDLAPLVKRGPDIPDRKALLSREGGRCERCGQYLYFDPWLPHVHRCTRCNIEHRGELHDRFRLYWYHLWLAERSVHAALLWRLRGDESHRELARAILDGYADRYLQYPNSDNVLGPARVFFSTYLESIWLLQLCIAVDLFDGSDHSDARLGARVRDLIIEPASSIIASYDEGLSNRQVWNVAALLASAALLDRDASFDRLLGGPSGLMRLISDALLADGSWYEGENYHLFAHRGIWYGVTLAENRGATLPPSLDRRFREGFALPFLTAYPDLTFPARRDSPHGVSLRQWRFAELCELGLARFEDRRLESALARMYAADIAVGDTGRWNSSAEVERNAPASRLDRSSLGWRSLLFARPTLPELRTRPVGTVHLEAQGLVVFRRNADHLYAALDYGHPGGGHGHPDRLSVLLADGSERLLDDMGTGSYVDGSLFWYRSTLAHNAPMIDGRTQASVAGDLVAFDERGAAGWVSARWRDPVSAADLVRSVVIMSGYVIDELRWSAGRDVRVDLPLHVQGALAGDRSWEESRPTCDGSEYLGRAARAGIDAGEVVALDVAAVDGRPRRLAVTSSAGGWWWRCTALGPAGTGDRDFQVVSVIGTSGAITMVWTLDPAEVELSGGEVRWRRGDELHVHRRTERGWLVELHAGSAKSSIELGGAAAPRGAGAGDRDDGQAPDGDGGIDAPATTGPAIREPPLDSLPTLRPGDSVSVALGEPHYRRSEESWQEAGCPHAELRLLWSGTALELLVDVRTSHLAFAAADAVNRYDNEHPDINGDGVQLYLDLPGWSAGWMIVPEPDRRAARVRPLHLHDAPHPRTSWRLTAGGYVLAVEIPVAATGAPAVLSLDVLVNLTRPGRERRSGQLVLTGGAGEFVYLRGDRHDPRRRARVVLAP